MYLLQPDSQKRVLLIMLDFMEWHRGRAWGYTGNFAIEEGLQANNVECVVLPAIFEATSDSSQSWLSHARTLLAGQTFDQVWVWLVHNNYDASFWAWLDELAPVKVGWLGESLEYHPSEINIIPHLAERRQIVTEQIKHMTHILAVDEYDADYVNSNNLAQAIWLPMAVPERTIFENFQPPQNNSAVFYGSVYGERRTWLKSPAMASLLTTPSPPENRTDLPARFDQLNLACMEYLAAGHGTWPALVEYVANLREIRRSCFDIWIDDLKKWLAVVNLPSFGKVYTSRVVETMAAGRPVISWEVPERPQNRALFEDGQEILLYKKEEPEMLEAHIIRLQTDPEFGQLIASNARKKVWCYHTVEKRAQQILNWIHNGVDPIYS